MNTTQPLPQLTHQFLPMTNTDEPRDPHNLTPEPGETLSFDDSRPICVIGRDHSLPTGGVVEVMGFEPGEQTMMSEVAYTTFTDEFGFGELDKDELIYIGATGGSLVADTEPLYTPVEVCITAWQYHCAVCACTGVNRIYNEQYGPFPFALHINDPESALYFRGYRLDRYNFDHSKYPLRAQGGRIKHVMVDTRLLKHRPNVYTSGPSPPSPSI